MQKPTFQGKGLKLEILFYDCLPSTQKYLADAIRSREITKSCAVIAKKQFAGIGSRNNSWEGKEGDLLFSFAIEKERLPQDLPINSTSIYFAFLMKELLQDLGQECWLKWPNDIYKKNQKGGGVVTQLIKGFYIVGIGVNLVKRDDGYAYFNIKKSVRNIVKSYFLLLKNAPKWKEVLSKFRLEFENNIGFTVTVKGVKMPINRGVLCDDGALLIDNERIYSLR